jgi:hypothetical protein
MTHCYVEPNFTILADTNPKGINTADIRNWIDVGPDYIPSWLFCCDNFDFYYRYATKHIDLTFCNSPLKSYPYIANTTTNCSLTSKLWDSKDSNVMRIIDEILVHINEVHFNLSMVDIDIIDAIFDTLILKLVCNESVYMHYLEILDNQLLFQLKVNGPRLDIIIIGCSFSYSLL